MKGVKSENKHASSNPFLGDKADELWEKLDKKGKPVTKEQLLNELREARSKHTKL